jgi:predicted metal-dependent peptidase
VYSPGTKNGNLPSIAMYADTSGSISHTELNEFLDVVDNFLRVGTKTCKIGLWHTDLYLYKKYKLGERLKQSEIQSGGTDPDPVLRRALKENIDLTIIITDGYYDKSEVPKFDKELIWIISKNGNASHPNAHLGKTIMMESLLPSDKKAS